MSLLMYGSLAVAMVCITGYIILIHFKSRAFIYRAQIKKVLICGGAIFYLVFIGLSLHTYQGRKASIQTISAEAKGNIKKVVAAVAIGKSNTAVANSKINVKIRTVPAAFKPNQPLTLQFIVANESGFAVKDLRMNFLQGDLPSCFIINEIKGNSKIDIFDNIVTLGTLKVDESKKIQFDLTPKNAVNYTGQIVWQAGNNYIYGEDNRPLESIISLELDEYYQNPEDESFNDFGDLKPIDEIVEEQEPVIAEDDLAIIETDNQSFTDDELDAGISEDTQQGSKDTNTSVIDNIYSNDSSQEGE